MPLSPQDIRDLTFNTVRKGGYDQREVESFRTDAAGALETAIQAATAMEARARAAVSRLQELQNASASAPAEDEASTGQASVAVGADEAETITRTLLLAQRTADSTIAAAEQEARRLRESAESEANSLIEAAKAESRQAGEAERVRVEGEVQALLARRDFLESDVDHLEQYLHAQRERLNEVASELQDITSRVGNGLGEMRPPQLSASNADHSDEVDAGAVEGSDDGPDVAELIEQVSEHDDQSAEAGESEPAPGAGEASDGDRHTLFTADDQR